VSVDGGMNRSGTRTEEGCVEIIVLDVDRHPFGIVGYDGMDE
jgi:hypothetical protein